MHRKINSPVRAEITIRRPNGNIEIVEAPGTKQLNDNLFSRISDATKNAGRGECLSYENITIEKIVDGPTRAEIESDRHYQELKTQYRNDAFGEAYDDLRQNDRTPNHKTDY